VRGGFATQKLLANGKRGEGALSSDLDGLDFWVETFF
jgi:hypothetical protein